MVLKAIGQSFEAADVPEMALQERPHRHRRQAGRTSHAKVWAGGDCRFGGRDLTVEAVEHGKVAAMSIDNFLRS